MPRGRTEEGDERDGERKEMPKRERKRRRVKRDLRGRKGTVNERDWQRKDPPSPRWRKDHRMKKTGREKRYREVEKGTARDGERNEMWRVRKGREKERDGGKKDTEREKSQITGKERKEMPHRSQRGRKGKEKG